MGKKPEIVGDAHAMPMQDDRFDAALAISVLEPVDDPYQVVREMYRVLKPGGQFAVSDVVIQGELAPEIRASMDAWAGCVAGALEEGGEIVQTLVETLIALDQKRAGPVSEDHGQSAMPRGPLPVRGLGLFRPRAVEDVPVAPRHDGGMGFGV